MPQTAAPRFAERQAYRVKINEAVTNSAGWSRIAVRAWKDGLGFADFFGRNPIHEEGLVAVKTTEMASPHRHVTFICDAPTKSNRVFA
jgi:hypothetical protein